MTRREHTESLVIIERPQKYADIVFKSGDNNVLYSLAFEYERAGDNQAALQIYNFMIDSFRNGSLNHRLGKVGKSRLGVVSNNCVLRKPDWWSQYEGKPDWWSNCRSSLAFKTVRDSSGTNGAKNFHARGVKAFMLLAESQPIGSSERVISAIDIGLAYADEGDHHRAIESEWRVSERLSVYPFDITNGLKFIAREFEALGETNHAKEVRDAIPCFSKWPRDIVRK